MPTHYVYILYSKKCDRYYVGYSANVDERLLRHNQRKVTATKNCVPYILKAFKVFESEALAMAEERRIKKQKSRQHIESLIAGNW